MRTADPRSADRARRLRLAGTEPEGRLWGRLRNRRLKGFKFVRQEPIGRYVVDFVCREARLIVEVDGGQHAESKRDAVRDAWLRSRNYRVLRFWNTDVMRTLPSALETILAALPPSPRARGEGRGDLVVDASSPQGDGEGAVQVQFHPDTPPHPRSARFAPDKGGSALSPQAGRGGLVP